MCYMLNLTIQEETYKNFMSININGTTLIMKTKYLKSV